MGGEKINGNRFLFPWIRVWIAMLEGTGNHKNALDKKRADFEAPSLFFPLSAPDQCALQRT